MIHPSLDHLLADWRRKPVSGPVALIFAEDDCEIASTVAHACDKGFRTVVVVAQPHIGWRPDAGDDKRVVLALHDFMIAGSVPATINRLIAAMAPGTWVHWGYNSEYLLYPFAESRSVGELLTFHGEERRKAMFCHVIDLYAADMGAHPDGISRTDAAFDTAGYYALQRHAADGTVLERQVDVFGGLRWRFEEHVPWENRRIDRIALFRTEPGLTMRADFTLSDEEMNTYACPWHSNLTAAVASFRAAKALRSNPGSKWAIQGFSWARSARFDWSSRQLMELGLMEPGQWF